MKTTWKLLQCPSIDNGMLYSNKNERTSTCNNTDESYRRDVMSSERSKSTREDIYDSFDAKFKNGQNSTVIEIRLVVTLGHRDWKGTQGVFQGGGDVLFLNLGSGS